MIYPNRHAHTLSVRNAFDLLARQHDEFISTDDVSDYDKEVSEYLAPYLNQVEPDGLVLDIGCGSGQWSLSVLRSGRRVHALDISFSMTELARAKSPDLPVCQMDAMEMGLDSNRYSVLLAIGDVLSYASDVDQILREARRVSRLGSLLVGTVISTGGILVQELRSGGAETIERLLDDGIWMERSMEELQAIARQQKQQNCELTPLFLQSYTRDRLVSVLTRNKWQPREIKGIGVLRRLAAGDANNLLREYGKLESILRITYPWYEISTNLFFAAQRVID